MLSVEKIGFWNSQKSHTSQHTSPEKFDPKEKVIYQQTRLPSSHYTGLHKTVPQAHLQGQAMSEFLDLKKYSLYHTIM